MGRPAQRPRYAVKATATAVVEPSPRSEAECSTTATTATDEGENEVCDNSTTKEVESVEAEVEVEVEAEEECAEDYSGWAEGMGFFSPFDLGGMGLAVPGVPGYNSEGVPGVFIPTMAFDQASAFFMHPGLVFDEDPALLQGLSDEDCLAAASRQTELLLEALTENLPEGRHAARLRKEAEKEALANGSEVAAWPPVEPEVGEADAEVPEEEEEEEEEAAAEAAAEAATEEAAPKEAREKAAAPKVEKEESIVPSLPKVAAIAEIQAAAYQAPSYRERDRRGGGGSFSDARRQARKKGERLHEERGWELGRSSGSGLCWDRRPIHFTTVMLRNIPNKYTRDMLVNQLNMHLRGKFDFLYLPMDFKNGCNVGYGFINFRSVEACRTFVGRFSGVEVSRCLPGINNSNKVAEVTPARVQGFDDNVKRLRISPVMQELIQHSEWMPLVFDEKGLPSPLPLPDGPQTPFRPNRKVKGGK